ncbi:Holliday junction resolvase RuvX [Sinimarinibacterium sp. CAU 1509]|uniref:Holliday junction resolvase RuvX n=1 Tax=Sinimarinibacterium sp. CAU 1509 TaxID=2562283 RepID=UPI0010AD1E64|nr:Holliday junction resolvase RuvX [Sinimarinibacterium sp. CAU 1509]TJY61996.1 Holliday junction resolvase RuvX [Sinimarinibacterium sp. CAU 1509]
MSLYLAFDFGFKRIGAAVGDEFTGSARPVPTLQSGDWPAIERLITQWSPTALIVGLPLNEDGSEQPITTAARRFAEALRQRAQLQVHLVDERYSSRAADDILRGARAGGQMSRRVRKGDRDGQAARVILEQWMAQRG